MVDPVADEAGSFRVIIEPDEHGWPDHQLLRVGLKAHAWVLLGQVPLAWEVWRRLNDFPPEDGPSAEKSSSTDPVERTKPGKAWKK